jgi:hypothetical protein
MIKVFIPEIKGRVKSSIRGFWYSQDTKRTYYDYLRVIDTCNKDYISINYLEALKKKYNQEAIFYKSDIRGFIYTGKDKLVILSNHIYSEVKNLKREIKEALKLYCGVTIYQKNGKYYKEIFYK